MAKYPLNVLQISLGVLLGFCLGIGTSYCGLIKFDGTISAGSILRAFTTILVAIFVAGYLRKYFDQTRKEKEVIFGLFDQFEEPISKIETWGSSEDFNTVTSELHQLSKKAEFICKVLADAGYGEAIVNICDFLDKIEQIRTLTTYTPPRSKATGTQQLSISKDVVSWDVSRQKEIEIAVGTLRRSVFSAQLMFNKS